MVAMRTKGNAVTEIKKTRIFHREYPYRKSFPTKLKLLVSIASRISLPTGSDYTLGETSRCSMVTACPVSIEAVVEFVECGALTNIIARNPSKLRKTDR